jgi:PAS domain S-box-containing protein
MELKKELSTIANNMAKVGGWEFNVATGKGTWTDQVAIIHEMDPAEETNVEKGLSFYSGESRRAIEKAINDAVFHALPYDLELQMVTAKGNHRWVRTKGFPVMRDEKVVKVRGIFMDISESKTIEREREIALDFLKLLNETKGTKGLVQQALDFFQQRSGCEAVGIRLNKNGDYPYYEVRGFGKEFVELENYLCVHDAEGCPLKGKEGEVVLSCMCGVVISGNTNPAKPFFSKGGSFWANNTTRLLATTTDEDRQAHTRNRCNGEGYESVALIPLRHKGTCIGLLQLNDKRPDMFSQEIIEAWERLSGYLSVALAESIAEGAVNESERRYHSLFENMLNGFAYNKMVFVDGKPKDFIYLDANASFERLTGLKDVVGKRLSEVVPGLIESNPELLESYGRVAQNGRPERFELPVEQLGMWFDITVYSTEPEYFVTVFDNITDRKKIDSRISTLNQLLMSVRNINQLITREHDRQKLIRGACQNLVETRGFNRCWIAVVDQEGTVIASAEAGIGIKFNPMIEYFKKSGLPPCTCDSIRLSKARIIDPIARTSVCGDCKLHSSSNGENSLIAAMNHEGMIKGILAVGVPANIDLDQEELDLFQEVADDIGFALNNLELEAIRDNMENELVESEKRYRSLVDNTPSGISIIQNDNIVFANQREEELTGYSLQELREINPFSIIRNEDRKTVIRYSILRAEGEAAPESFDMGIYPKNGTLRWISRRVVPIKWQGQEATLILDSDISERKQAELELSEEIQRRRGLFEQIPVGIVIINPETSEILEFNKIAHEQLGYSREEFRALKISDVEAMETPEETNSRITSILQDGRMEFDTLQKTRQGEIRNVHVTAQTVNISGNRVYQCIWQDITERKRMDEKLIMTDRLASLGEMSAGIAHEINNPLTGIVGFAEMLLASDLPEDVRNDIQVISDGGKRVTEIVKRMLTFARQVKPVKSKTDINELIERTLDLQNYSLKMSNIEVVKHFDPDLPWVTVDSGQMQQVFLNLIINAQYAMHKAHGHGKLDISTAKSDGNFQMVFKDDGPGIAPSILGKIFQPFFTTKEPGEGTGLGLSMSRSIVLDHAGSMEVISKEGQGACFVIDIPFDKSQSD